MFVNPAAARSASYSAIRTGRQPTSDAFECAMKSGMGRSETRSEIITRPPGLSARIASASTLGRQVEDAVRNDDVRDAVGYRQGLDLAQPELDVGPPTLERVGAGPFHHLGGHVHADDPALGPDALRGQEAVEAGARAEVEHGFARSQRRQRHGVAASKTEVGALGGAVQFVLIVADSAADLVGGSLRGAGGCSRTGGCGIAVRRLAAGVSRHGRAGVSFAHCGAPFGGVEGHAVPP